jgi:hypothetical protein
LFYFPRHLFTARLCIRIQLEQNFWKRDLQVLNPWCVFLFDLTHVGPAVFPVPPPGDGVPVLSFLLLLAAVVLDINEALPAHTQKQKTILHEKNFALVSYLGHRNLKFHAIFDIF